MNIFSKKILLFALFCSACATSPSPPLPQQICQRNLAYLPFPDCLFYQDKVCVEKLNKEGGYVNIFSIFGHTTIKEKNNNPFHANTQFTLLKKDGYYWINCPYQYKKREEDWSISLKINFFDGKYAILSDKSILILDIEKQLIFALGPDRVMHEPIFNFYSLDILDDNLFPVYRWSYGSNRLTPSRKHGAFYLNAYDYTNSMVVEKMTDSNIKKTPTVISYKDLIDFYEIAHKKEPKIILSRYAQVSLGMLMYDEVPMWILE